MEGEGYYVELVEHYNAWTKRRHDLLGFADLLCIHLERPGDIMLVQSTSASNVSARVRKITDHENLSVARKAGFRIEVHGWRLSGRKYICRREDLS